MKRFQFRLASLVRLRDAARKERRTQLADAYRADEVLQRQQAQLQEAWDTLEQQQRAAAGPGKVDVDRLLAAQRYGLALGAQRQQLANQRRWLGEEIERRRQALMEADRAVRILEKLEQRQRQRHAVEENREQIKLLDEAAACRAVGEGLRE
jgi:flagellar export protein FliJ